MKYYLNDPSTPELFEEIQLPSALPNPPFSVNGANTSAEYPEGTSGYRANGCLVSIANSLSHLQTILSLNKWASTNKLIVVPEAGKQLNAYYDKNSLKFFFEHDAILNKTVYTSDSRDVVCHELGHAILDAIRPDLWNMASLEIWAFHEAFGDINSMISIMQYDKVLNNALEKTNGDLTKPNVISSIAEEMGKVFFKNNNPLREATKIYFYKNPQELPKTGTSEEIFAECHSFGKIFMTSWYECFAKIYAYESEKMAGIEAIKKARDNMASYLYAAIKSAPKQNQFTPVVARILANSAKSVNPIHGEICEAVLRNRKLIVDQVGVLQIKTVNFNSVKTIKLSEHLVGELSSDFVHPLFDAEIEVPGDNYYEFDKSENIIFGIEHDDKKLVYSTLLCIEHLKTGILNGMWKIEDNKLSRNFMA